LPFTLQVQGPPGSQTIALAGAASLMVVQSESTPQGYCGRMQMPQPELIPPGLHP
jgi:hypothetical protein